jgi:hypothetical protein
MIRQALKADCFYKQSDHNSSLKNISLILLASEPSKLVRNNDIQLGSTFHNGLTLLGRDVVSYLSTVCPV